MVPNSGYNQQPNPFGAYPGAMPQMGNPANTGFAPTGLQTGMGGLADAIAKIILQQAGIDGPIRSFGRPQVSDYAYSRMQERGAAAEQHMAGIYGSSPSNRMFGELGKNSLFQQYVADPMSAGGSRAEQFQQIMGQFGNSLSESANPEVVAKKAAQVLRNVDNQFSTNGAWDYSKTAGFNRSNFTSAVSAFTNEFGGESAIETLAETEKKGTGHRGAGGNTQKIAQAGDQIKQMAEAVREAGNFFGPNMPYDELMKNVKKLVGNAQNMTAGDVRTTMQKVQAMAVTVNMSNEAYAAYMDAIGEINQASGGTMNTVDLSAKSLRFGKAIEDNEKAKAEKAGKIYTGPDATTLGLDVARVFASRESSPNAIVAKTFVADALESNTSYAKELAEIYKTGDYEAVRNRIEELKKDGKISEAEWARNMETSAKRESGEIDDTVTPEIMDSLMKERDVNPVMTEEQAASKIDNTIRETEKAIYGNTFQRYSDKIEAAGGEEKLRAILTTENLASEAKLKEALTKDYGEEVAAELANDLYIDSKTKDKKNAADTIAKLKDPEAKKREAEILIQNTKNEEKIAEISKNSNIFSDASLGEETGRLGLEVWNDIQKKGGGKKEFFEEMMKRAPEMFTGENGRTKLKAMEEVFSKQEELSETISEKSKKRAKELGVEVKDLSEKEVEKIRGESIEQIHGKHSFAGQIQKVKRETYDERYEEYKKMKYSDEEAHKLATKDSDKEVEKFSEAVGLGGGKEGESNKDLVSLIIKAIEGVADAIRKTPQKEDPYAKQAKEINDKAGVPSTPNS
jgi:antitoxin component of MazEF toxin-antitoxin module